MTKRIQPVNRQMNRFEIWIYIKLNTIEKLFPIYKHGRLRPSDRKINRFEMWFYLKLDTFGKLFRYFKNPDTIDPIFGTFTVSEDGKLIRIGDRIN